MPVGHDVTPTNLSLRSLRQARPLRRGCGRGCGSGSGGSGRRGCRRFGLRRRDDGVDRDLLLPGVEQGLAELVAHQ